MCTQPQKFSYIHAVAASVVLSKCNLNYLSVNNMSLFNFYKKTTMWQFEVRSHVTQNMQEIRVYFNISALRI